MLAIILAAVLAAPRPAQPVRLLPSEPHPKLLKPAEVPASICSAPAKLILAELIVEPTGRVSEVRFLKLPMSCDQKKLRGILKSWTYEQPLKNGQPVAIFQTIAITFDAK